MEITDIQQLHTTDWLILKQASCINKEGRKKILLLKEFRTPINKWVIEFPKGIININETIENAALRELKEETGYTGKLIKVSPLLTTCAYLTNEKAAIVEIEVDVATLGATNHEKAEEIAPFWI